MALVYVVCKSDLEYGEECMILDKLGIEVGFAVYYRSPDKVDEIVKKGKKKE